MTIFIFKGILVPVIMVVSSIVSYGQKSANPRLDTANLVVRICKGDLPGQKRELNADYILHVCAYTYNNNKLVTFNVIGFDLFYIDRTNQITESASAKGNLFTSNMRLMLMNTEYAIENFFLANVILADSDGVKILVNGLRPLVHK